MIERPTAALPEQGSGRTGTSCAYRCPGCPIERHTSALTIRVTGSAPDWPSIFSRFQNRNIEWASGELPADSESFVSLRDKGVRKILIPVMGVEKSHDQEVGIPGAFAAASQSIQAALRADLPVAVLIRATDPSSRAAIRFAWDALARPAIFNSPAPPCIAEN